MFKLYYFEYLISSPSHKSAKLWVYVAQECWKLVYNPYFDIFRGAVAILVASSP